MSPYRTRWDSGVTMRRLSYKNINKRPRMRNQHKKLQQFQKQMAVPFHNEKWLQHAFTHSSYVNEQRRNQHEHNERLEFLGDAVLELTVSKYLFTHFPDMSEGELTKLRASIVC